MVLLVPGAPRDPSGPCRRRPRRAAHCSPWARETSRPPPCIRPLRPGPGVSTSPWPHSPKRPGAHRARRPPRHARPCGLPPARPLLLNPARSIQLRFPGDDTADGARGRELRLPPGPKGIQRGPGIRAGQRTSLEGNNWFRLSVVSLRQGSLRQLQRLHRRVQHRGSAAPDRGREPGPLLHTEERPTPCPRARLPPRD